MNTSPCRSRKPSISSIGYSKKPNSSACRPRRNSLARSSSSWGPVRALVRKLPIGSSRKAPISSASTRTSKPPKPRPRKSPTSMASVSALPARVSQIAAQPSVSAVTSWTALRFARCWIRSPSPTVVLTLSASRPESSSRRIPLVTSPTTSGRSPLPSMSPAATSSRTKPSSPGRNRASAVTLSSPRALMPP